MGVKIRHMLSNSINIALLFKAIVILMNRLFENSIHLSRAMKVNYPFKNPNEKFSTKSFTKPFYMYFNSINLRQLATKRNRSLYEILNVPKSATQREIKLAYFREVGKLFLAF